MSEMNTVFKRCIPCDLKFEIKMHCLKSTNSAAFWNKNKHFRTAGTECILYYVFYVFALSIQSCLYS